MHLASGDMIPADVRIIASKDLFVGQSSLTGESEPVEKHDSLRRIDDDPDRNLSLSELDDICFMGTTVVSGAAVAVVLSTGNDTYFGSMAKTIVGKRELTSFDKGLNKVSWGPHPVYAFYGPRRVSDQRAHEGELASGFDVRDFGRRGPDA